jgi:anti-sigma regulatory factor (Ser/Thr protein kinase)
MSDLASVELELPFDATAPQRARAAVAQLTANADVDVVVGELVTNAIRHGHGPIRFCAARTDAGLRIEVSDTRRDLGPSASDSMGLRLVDTLAFASGVDHRDHEKIVWALVAM